MREVFQQELSDVQNGLVEAANLVLSAITNATKAFEESDVSLADKVISNDTRIDELTARIEDLTVEILLLQAPVARDLRFIVTTMRIGGSLERMGDLAAHIAQLARLRFPEVVGPAELRESFLQVGQLCTEQARRMRDLLDTEEAGLIDEIVSSDDAIDDLHKHVLEYLTDHSDELGAAAKIVDATLANRYFERFSDHAVDIANRMRYLKDGAPETDDVSDL